MVRRAEAKYTITAEDRTARAFRSVTRRLDNLRIGARRAGGALLGFFGGRALLSGLNKARAEIDEIAKFAQALGVRDTFLSTLAFQAELSGTNLKTVVAGMRALSRNQLAAAQGSKQSADAFRLLNIDLEQFSRLDPATQLVAVATQLNKIQSPSLRTGIAQQILGRAGVSLLPLLETLATDLQGVGERAQQAGATFDNEFGDKIEKLNDDLVILQQEIVKTQRRFLEFAADRDLVARLENILSLVNAIAAAVNFAGTFLGETAAKGTIAVQRNPGSFARIGGALRRQTSGRVEELLQSILEEDTKQTRELTTIRDTTSGGARAG